MERTHRYLTAREAAGRLGISVATLYAYVSRGLLRSEAGEGPSRARRYLAEEVEALGNRKAYRRDPAGAVQDALSFGLPVLASALTSMAEGTLAYRGYDVLALAQQRTVEEVAALLWRGRLEAGDLFAQPARTVTPPPGLAVEQHPIECYQTVLAQAAVDDLAAYLTAPEAVAATGARILHLLVTTTSGRPVAGPVAGALRAAWAPGRAEIETLLSAALILCADHELNVSAFTARCVASAGATPYAVVIAGLAALQGHRHGGNTERVGHLLREARCGIPETLAGYLRQGAPLPGFGHPLYPDGDPRARLLLALIEERAPSSEAAQLAGELAHTVFDLTGLRPTVDFALETLAQTLELPPRAALALFALSRTIGWVGHAIEQVATGELIRPRAQYVGEALRAVPVGDS